MHAPGTLIIAVLLLFLVGCGPNFYPIKEIRYKDFRITWYFQYRGDGRRDYVEVTKGFKSEIVLECFVSPITNIDVVNDSLVIRMEEVAKTSIHEFKSSGLGLPVQMDTTASEYEYEQVYGPYGIGYGGQKLIVETK